MLSNLAGHDVAVIPLRYRHKNIRPFYTGLFQRLFIGAVAKESRAAVRGWQPAKTIRIVIQDGNFVAVFIQ